MTREDALLIMYDEVNFLYTRGILSERSLGRTKTIFTECKRIFESREKVESRYEQLSLSLRSKYGYTPFQEVILALAKTNSLASDGWEMIEAAFRQEQADEIS